MASWIESRILVLEQRLEKLARDFAAMMPSVRAAQQQLNQGGSVPQTGGGGGGIFFANHLMLAAATGTWPGITPSTTTGDVYKVSGGAMVLVQAGATILNALPDATDNTKRQVLGANGDGTWSVIAQSCSAG